MIDLKAVSELLVKRGKVRGNPVAISLFSHTVPPGYEPIQDTPCSIVRYAMDEGKKIYFDADHHDCLVGVHHAGIIPGSQEITAGEYLSKPSNFFTYEGAARLKSGTPVLPTGMVKAIGAAPMAEVPEGVDVSWIVVVCNPHHANFIAGGRLSQEGVPAFGVFGTSLCGELFARPWHLKNMMVIGGDFGGRMHNKIKQDQLFVLIPIEFVHYLTNTLWNAKMNVRASREMTKPAHSKFWQKKAKEQETKAQEQAEDTKDEEQKVPSSITLTMDWDEDAKGLLKDVPEGILEMVVGNAEDYAREKGYDKVSKSSIDEQMIERFGMNLDEMIKSM